MVETRLDHLNTGLVFPAEEDIFHTDELQNKLEVEEGFIPAWLIHESDIHQHAKFTPKQGCCSTCFISCSLQGKSCDPLPTAQSKCQSPIHKKTQDCTSVCMLKQTLTCSGVHAQIGAKLVFFNLMFLHLFK